LTFKEWWTKYNKTKPFIDDWELMEKEAAQAAWQDAFLEGLTYQADRIREMQETINNLRKLREKHDV
jgi:hypothetical protein